jgi:hypothetical protein
MTVCIAVACDCETDNRNPKLILASDTLLSLGYTSAEVAFKARKLCTDWGIMIAGEDISHAMSVIDTAKGILEDKKGVAAGTVSDAVTEAYQIIRRSQLEDMYLKTYDLTMKEFVKEGKDFFPEVHHLELLNEFRRYDLGCQFLVAGFSHEKASRANFFMVENPGTASIFDDFGYCSIGSGSPNALAYLSRRGQSPVTSFEQSLYNIIGAKSLAEKATGVGANSTLVVQERGKTSHIPDFEKLSTIERIWKTEEEPFTPPNLIARIIEILGTDNPNL